MSVRPHAPAGCATSSTLSSVDRRPSILCVVDRPGWAHDRKTDALAAALASEFRIVKRYQAEVTDADLAGADCVLLYYWLQVERLAHLRPRLEEMRDRLLLGICSHFELEGNWREPGLETLDALPRATFVINLTLLRELRPRLRVPAFYTPNGVDTEFFRPGPAAAEIRPGTLRVGWAGSLTNQGPAQRGVTDLIEPAVAAVPGASLQLACREERWRDAAEMLDFYRELDVYVCASRNEGTPNPCLEASACGVPVITTRVGNMPEFIAHGRNGWFVERTVDAIAGALTTLRDDPALRAALGSAARVSAQTGWDWQVQSQRYAAMFRTVLAEPA